MSFKPGHMWVYQALKHDGRDNGDNDEEVKDAGFNDLVFLCFPGCCSSDAVM